MENILKSSGLVLLNSTKYNSWQFDQFRPFIGSTVLEIGCGLGNITQFLREQADFLLSVDTQPQAVAFIQERCPPNTKFKVEQMDIFRDGLKGYADVPFDTIVFSNVLEHIQDDVKAMAFCQEILKPQNGKLLLLVPAHTFLFGTLDVEAGHYRRYSKKAILHLAQLTNFKIIDLYAFNFTGALGWFINYCVLRRKGTNNEAGNVQVILYDRFLVAPSQWIEDKIRPPVGISYIAILQA